METFHNWMKFLTGIIVLSVLGTILGCGGGGDDGPPPAVDQVSTSRNLPDDYTPGGTISVILRVDVDESNNPNGFIVKDNIPLGWEINSSNPDNNFDSSTGEVKWVFYGDEVADMEITYGVDIPSSASGSKTFTGEVLYNDPQDNHITKTISGDTGIAG